MNPDAALTDDNNAAVDAALGAFGVSTCPDLIGYVMGNYGYSLDDACGWDGTGSPFSFGGMTIADMCGCSCPALAPEPVLGCTYPGACNFDLALGATSDDGSCTYPASAG